MKVFKRNISKVLAYAIIVSQVVCLKGEYAYAGTAKVYSEIRQQNAMDESVEKKGRKIRTEIDSEKHRRSESFRVDIKVEESDKAVYSYDTENISIIREEGSSIELEATAEEGFGSIDIYAEYADGEVDRETVYTYTKDDTVYVSEISEDTALYKCMKEKYDAGLITDKEWEDEYYKYVQTFVDTYIVDESECNENAGIALLSTDSTTTIKGKLQWTTPEGEILPLMLTKVELRDKDVTGAQLIATTYTDENGEYCFTFENPDEILDFENGGIDAFIQFYAEAETFGVNMDFLFLSYYGASTYIENISSGKTYRFDLLVNHNDASNATKAFCLQQQMLAGQMFAMKLGMETSSYVHVMFPLEFEGIGNELREMLGLESDYKFEPDSAFCVKLAGNYFSAIGSKNYSNADVLVHEYGHFVQHIMGVYGEALLNNHQYIMQHNMRLDNFAKGYPKQVMMELTWSESWANIFSQIAQNCYESQYGNITQFADGRYDDYTFETLNPGDASCEAQEAAVSAFLWDIYDSKYTLNSIDEADDNIALGYTNWWNYTTRKGTYTLDDFTNNVDGYFYNYRSQIGELLEVHQIAPGDVRVLNSYILSPGNSPRIMWKVNGSKNNPNNKFEVRFYDANGNLICKTEPIYSGVEYNQTVTYVVPSDVWSKVLAKYNGTFYINISIRGYNTTEFDSGPYMSGYTKCLVTNNATVNIGAGSRYTEKNITLDKGGVFTYNVKFATSGYKLIQTFGTMDTKISICSASGAELVSNDDAGYGRNAMCYYNFSANTTYQIKVKFYSTSSTGTTKLAITPANGNFTSSALSNYEGIYSITGKTSYSSVITTTANTTKVMTFTPPSSGSYTFEIQSGNDMYIYVIDPRSSALLTGTSYNDDSGIDLNPLLTKTLTAGVPYLIICTPFNPSSLTSTIGFSLKINKN